MGLTVSRKGDQTFSRKWRKMEYFNFKQNISHGIVILLQVVRNHSREIQMTKTLAAMLDDRNNKAYYNSSFNGNPILRRCRKLQRSTIKPLQIMHLGIFN